MQRHIHPVTCRETTPASELVDVTIRFCRFDLPWNDLLTHSTSCLCRLHGTNPFEIRNFETLVFIDRSDFSIGIGYLEIELMNPTAALLITQGLNGLGYGMLLFLVSSGLTLIYGMMGFLNLSHAFFFMLGAYFCATFLQITNSFWISLVLAPFAVSLVGMLAERFFLRNLENNELGYIGQILPTLGIALIILTSVAMFWGRSLWIETPLLLQGHFFIGQLSYPIYRIFIIVLSFAVLILLSLIIFKTRMGLILRAAVSDSDMVSALGINISLIFTVVFGISVWLAGLAGVALTPVFFVNPLFAYQWALETFVVVIVGGLGSLPGAFVVAILFGELHSYGVQFTPRLAPILMFLIMILVLTFKPTGLFGKRG